MLIGIGASIYSGNRYDAAITSANLAARFDAALGITQSGGFVSAWADQSGNGNNLLQASGANQPAYDTTGGIPSLIFDGLTHYMKTAPFTLNQPTMVYLVAKQLAWGGRYLHDGNTPNSLVLYQNTASPQLALYAGSFGGNNANATIGSKVVIAELFNGASSALRVNLTAEVTGDVGAANAGGFTLGSNPAPGSFANIQAYEVLIYNTAHDAATRSNIIRALMSKHGVA